MSPLESVTHLCALIQMADGRVEYEEKQSWSNLIQKLFPDFLEDRADNFLTDAFKLSVTNKTLKEIIILWQ